MWEKARESQDREPREREREEYKNPVHLTRQIAKILKKQYAWNGDVTETGQKEKNCTSGISINAIHNCSYFIALAIWKCKQFVHFQSVRWRWSHLYSCGCFFMHFLARKILKPFARFLAMTFKFTNIITVIKSHLIQLQFCLFSFPFEFVGTHFSHVFMIWLCYFQT